MDVFTACNLVKQRGNFTYTLKSSRKGSENPVVIDKLTETSNEYIFNFGLNVLTFKWQMISSK
jgi:hypothetical protein